MLHLFRKLDNNFDNIMKYILRGYGRQAINSTWFKYQKRVMGSNLLWFRAIGNSIVT